MKDSIQGDGQKPPQSMTVVVRTTLCLVVTLSLGACSWNESRSQTLGGVLGGIAGAVVGSKLGKGTGRGVTTVIGATLGAMWGQDIAKGLSDADKMYSQRTTQDTLEYGKPGERAVWSNPDSGNSGTVTADEPYTNDDGQGCRQFETTVNVEGDERTATGTACRNAAGEWQIVDTPEASI
ncbi:RT0821/Lpp0805 family surface protein [Magnetovibrio sp.]|uniref:RT0821/Lpp0805 family surface protein n=1 Tax=Magnetovibrio sp. TaxID=2024836 RepID=UPI002F942E7D